MQTSINFTERKKILKSNFIFKTSEDSKGNHELSVELGDFDTNEFFGHERVYIEAYAKSTRQTIDCGIITKLELPSKIPLKGLDVSAVTLFEVKVVDESSKLGRLIALGQKFRANEDDIDNTMPLLPIVEFDLGEIPWKVSFEPTPNELHLNKSIPGATDRFKTDGMFLALVLPAALREILTHHLNKDDADENTEKWTEFAQSFGKQDSEDEVNEWIDKVIEGFCKKHKMTTERVMRSIEGESV
mgnify:FL=1